MSTVDSEIGRALRSDGSLKDASEIEWTCDTEMGISQLLLKQQSIWML